MIGSYMRGGAYTVSEGATIADLMSAAQLESGIELSNTVREHFSYIVNRKPSRETTVLHDGDMVRVLYKIFGG